MTKPPQVVHGDCLEIMRMLPNNSVDSIVTDPPYGLGFMGKAWDALPPGLEWAEECLRVLKPGGHLLAFGGTRTWHRLAVAVEDAGFEIRDSIAWMSGSGFPKSHNINKALGDKACQCREGEPQDATDPATEHDMRSVHEHDVPAPARASGGEGAVLLAGVQEQSAPTAGRQELSGTPIRGGKPGVEGWSDAPQGQGELHRSTLRPMPSRVDDDGAEGRLHHGASTGYGAVGGAPVAADGSGESHQPQPEGQQAGEPGTVPLERGPQARGSWQVCARCSKPVVPEGLGTALKPAFEPIVMGRKPFPGTVAANVLAHGTGALNIDATRIGTTDALVRPSVVRDDNEVYGKGLGAGTQHEPAGRWPANVVLDEHTAALLDEQSGVLKGRANKLPEKTGGGGGGYTVGMGKEFIRKVPMVYDGDGGASRFFYVAKAPKKERPVVDGVAHATVKPLALMRWLVRLVTPEGGTVLEPFAGSGTTVEACILEGFHCIAIEQEAEYLPLIQARIDRQGKVA